MGDATEINKQLQATKARLLQAKRDMQFQIDSAYPVGTRLRVRHGKGTAVVRVEYPAPDSRPTCVRCRHEHGRARYRRDVPFYDVLEVLDGN